jgi:methylated-DNA-[protein]-cysteine S-methyltransferase
MIASDLKKYLIMMKEYAKNGIDIIYSKLLGLHIEIEYNTALRSIRFLKPSENPKEKKTLDITFELERYFEGETVEFSSDPDISHLSPFEQKVLEEAKKIKYGRTISYSQLAENIGCKGAHAVGNALGKNPIPIVIPCHRFVAKKGIGGYSAGINIKTRLLELEKINFNNL